MEIKFNLDQWREIMRTAQSIGPDAYLSPGHLKGGAGLKVIKRDSSGRRDVELKYIPDQWLEITRLVEINSSGQFSLKPGHLPDSLELSVIKRHYTNRHDIKIRFIVTASGGSAKF